ncbi:MAG: MarR family winged helix-turn-helix transcriptional regulator [Acidimicrobiia bacterium]
MSDTAPNGLSRAELRAWRRVGTGFSRLLSTFDRQLRDDAGLSLDDFDVLATLASAPGGAMRMAVLAERISFSPSRLSHAVQRMEQRGWVTRESTPDDRRGRVAHLTEQGDQVLRAAWPGHADLIRRLVIDPLDPEQFEALGESFARISQAVNAERDRCEPTDGNS